MKYFAAACSVPRECLHYLTPGKEYEVINDDGIGFEIVSDNGREIFCLWDGCEHLGGSSWNRAEGHSNALRNDAPALLDALEHIVSRYESLVHDLFDGTSTIESRLAEADKARALIAKHRSGV